MLDILPLKTSLTLFWEENWWIDYQAIGWGLQHWRVVLVAWRPVWLCSGVLGMSVGWMMFGLKEKTERCPVSALWTLLTLWGEIGVDSIPFFSLSLCLCLSINPDLCHKLFQLHPYLTFPLSTSLSGSSLPLLLLPLSPLLSFPPPPLLISLPAVRSWVLRSESGWRVLGVRAWRAGRRPSATASAVPLATRWWEAPSWWAGARPKCRRAGASTIGPGLGRRWGWRVRLALLSQMVSHTVCLSVLLERQTTAQCNNGSLPFYTFYTAALFNLKPDWTTSGPVITNKGCAASLCANAQKSILYCSGDPKVSKDIMYSYVRLYFWENCAWDDAQDN